MKTSENIIVTQNRMQKSIENTVNRVAMPQITEQIQETVESEKVRKGVITKFYHYLDKAEVEFEDEETSVCKILHRFGGGLIDFFTPVEDEITFCEDLHEPCIIPQGTLNVLCLNITNDDEPVILGYFIDEELIGCNPAAPGNFKIVTRGGANQFWIKFGYNGLDLRLQDTATTNVGEMDQDMKPVDYANVDNVYTKDEVYTKEDVYNKLEVYTKEEVDELIRDRIAEALESDEEEEG